MTQKSKYGILGAGPSGLSLSHFLDSSTIILEKESYPGGHASSFFIDGFPFDYGPHLLFSKNERILSYIVDSLGNNVQRKRRNSKILFKDKLIKYPFENNLSALSPEDNYECLRDYCFNPHKNRFSPPQNMKEWLLTIFGEGICEKYLFPYNEKVWNIPVDRLSMMWADRIPVPSSEDILKSSLGIETEGFLSQLNYYYPMRGGFQAICDKWAEDCNVHYGTMVKKIEKLENVFYVITNMGDYEFENLISTIPIQELHTILNIKTPPEIQSSLSKLITHSLILVSLGIKGEDPNKYTAIYLPEDHFTVNRISFPSTFSSLNAPDGHYSIQAEITCRPNSTFCNAYNDWLLDLVKAELRACKILSSTSDIVVADVRRRSPSYVVCDTNYYKNVWNVRNWFQSIGIHLLGRFSYFEYINIDAAVLRAEILAEQLKKEVI
jgi:protoporphyrinogen oxidase